MEGDERPAPRLDPFRLDLLAIHAALRAGKGDDGWMREWLAPTYAAPDRFFEALYAFAQSRRGGALKGRALLESVDLYHDLVLAHVGRRKTAIVARESGAWEDATYEALHARASALASAWARAGVEVGQHVCVVGHANVEYASAVLAALRLGLVVSAIPPIGPTFVRTRLEALEPDRVVVSDRRKPIVGRFAETALPIDAGARDAAAQTSHAYGPDDVALRLVSPMREEGPPVFDVPAARLHRSLLRDALFTYALDATDVLSAPGFDPLQHQPHLLLTALMAGATWAEIDARELEADPRALDAAHVTVLGIKRSVRAPLVARGVEPLRGLRAWFRSLSEVLDVGVWDELAKLFTEKKVPGFHVLANAATGGGVMFGRRTMGPLGLVAWPVPGETWQLSEIAAGTLPALNEAGAYTILRDEEEDTSLARFVLGRLGEGYVFSGSVDVGPDAQAYPCAEVARVAETHPAVRHAAAIVAGGRWVNEGKVVLLAFTEPARDPEGRLVPAAAVHELRALIAREMGEPRVPHRIEVFPLRPRMKVVDPKKGREEVDVSWCRSQYLSGALLAKSRSDLFVLSSELAYIFAGPARGA